MARASQPVALTGELDGRRMAEFEQTNPWPLIPVFLATLPPGSVGADLGCGNGKYLYLRSAVGPQNRDGALLTLGADRCLALVQDAQHNRLRD
ncbi:tRNA (carboxymethyluridine(34)-5-O)-methyltransferase [Malassezia sp. CBS 17886]|nr:tRNA (carboxymethyluridine(34)-5-O)-methyltransferase [Malassezia sp. CBS 17886]